MAGEIEAIEKVVWTYLDGLYEGDTGKLGQAFHEGSHLYWMEGGAVVCQSGPGRLEADSRRKPLKLVGQVSWTWVGLGLRISKRGTIVSVAMLLLVDPQILVTSAE